MVSYIDIKCVKCNSNMYYIDEPSIDRSLGAICLTVECSVCRFEYTHYIFINNKNTPTNKVWGTIEQVVEKLIDKLD